MAATFIGSEEPQNSLQEPVLKNPIENYRVRLTILERLIRINKNLSQKIKIASPYVRLKDPTKTFPTYIFEMDLECLNKYPIDPKELECEEYSLSFGREFNLEALLSQYKDKPQCNPEMMMMFEFSFINNYLGDLNAFFKQFCKEQFRVLFRGRKELGLSDLIFSTNFSHRNEGRPKVQKKHDPTTSELMDCLEDQSCAKVGKLCDDLIKIEVLYFDLIEKEIEQVDLPEPAKSYVVSLARKLVKEKFGVNKLHNYTNFLFDILNRVISASFMKVDPYLPYECISLWDEEAQLTAETSLVAVKASANGVSQMPDKIPLVPIYGQRQGQVFVQQNIVHQKVLVLGDQDNYQELLAKLKQDLLNDKKGAPLFAARSSSLPLLNEEEGLGEEAGAKSGPETKQGFDNQAEATNLASMHPGFNAFKGAKPSLQSARKKDSQEPVTPPKAPAPNPNKKDSAAPITPTVLVSDGKRKRRRRKKK